MEMRERAFLREGHMVAMPLGFPGVTTFIDPNDSFITCLAAGSDQVIYGGCSGTAAHLFAAGGHASGGTVVDLGGDGTSTHCAAVACTKTQVVVAMNGAESGRLLARRFLGRFNTMQEWSVDVTPPELR